MNDLWGSVRYNGREFEMPDAVYQRLDALVKQTGRSERKQDHVLMGQALVEPIRKIAIYKRWTDKFFMPMPIEPGQDNAVPLDDYTAIAFYSSPTGQVFYTRPGRQYVRPDFVLIDAGIEIGWDDMAEAGWNMLARKQEEAGEELARKADTQAQSVLDAAVTAASHTSTVSSSMTKAAIDSILRSAADIGFPIQFLAVNTGTAMDMSDWVFPASNSAWSAPETVREELWRSGFTGTYNGVSILAHHSVPTDFVYLSAGAEHTGWEQTKGQNPRSAADVLIDKRIDRFQWDVKKAWTVANNYAVWRLQIT